MLFLLHVNSYVIATCTHRLHHFGMYSSTHKYMQDGHDLVGGQGFAFFHQELTETACSEGEIRAAIGLSRQRSSEGDHGEGSRSSGTGGEEQRRMRK